MYMYDHAQTCLHALVSIYSYLNHVYIVLIYDFLTIAYFIVDMPAQGQTAAASGPVQTGR